MQYDNHHRLNSSALSLAVLTAALIHPLTLLWLQIRISPPLFHSIAASSFLCVPVATIAPLLY